MRCREITAFRNKLNNCFSVIYTKHNQDNAKQSKTKHFKSCVLILDTIETEVVDFQWSPFFFLSPTPLIPHTLTTVANWPPYERWEQGNPRRAKSPSDMRLGRLFLRKNVLTACLFVRKSVTSWQLFLRKNVNHCE